LLTEEKRLLTEEKRLLNEEKHRLHIENCTFRGKVEEAKIALVEVKNRAGEDEEKYFELVSVARGYPPKSNKYQTEIQKLSSPKHGDWNHGFNSGMLAASRMYLGLAISTRDDFDEIYFSCEDDEESDEDMHLSVKLQGYRLCALDDFPFLDL
jgi:hypothetical protein